MRTVDIIVIILYLIGVALMGWYFSKRNNSTEEYFVGSRSYPGWVLGMSMLSTSISSFTFLALPAITFSLDWRQSVPNLIYPLPAIFACIFFIPFFRRANMISIYEYLEDRFGPLMRLYGALSFAIIMTIGQGGSIYLVSIPISFLTGISIPTVIVISAVAIGLYTITGGIDAVIWTDVIQGMLLIFGGIIALAVICFKMPEGFTQIFDVAAAHNKFSFGSMGFSLNERTFWTIAIMGFWGWTAGFASTQQFAQRVAAAKSTRESRKALLLSAGLSMPIWGLFLFIGTALFAYYQVNGAGSIEGMKSDQIFPFFIMTKVPPVIAGLVIAGALSAAMSTIDSGINSYSAVLVTDLLKRYLVRYRDEAYYLKAGKVVALLYTMFIIVSGLFFYYFTTESAIDMIWTISSLLGGCIGAIFITGFFSTRVNYHAALFALSITLLFNGYLLLVKAKLLPECISLKLHVYWVGIVINLCFFVVAYAASFFFKSAKKDLKGLTVWTLKAKDDQPESAA